MIQMVWQGKKGLTIYIVEPFFSFCCPPWLNSPSILIRRRAVAFKFKRDAPLIPTLLLERGAAAGEGCMVVIRDSAVNTPLTYPSYMSYI